MSRAPLVGLLSLALLGCQESRISSLHELRDSGLSTSTGFSDLLKNALTVTLSGWDYDLKKRCIRTTGLPGDINYYEDNAQCESTGQHWTAVVESEVLPGQSCPGPINRSFPINSAGSPIKLNWIPHVSDLGPNWTVNLKVDQVTAPNPCGDGHFTYFGMLDHTQLNGGPLPAPLELGTSHDLLYDHWAPNPDSASRLVLGATFWWGGKAHWLEISPARTASWGDGHPDPAVILASKTWGTPDIEFLLLDGAAFGLGVTPGTGRFMYVDWKGVVTWAIQRGYFDAIPQGAGSVTQSVYIGVEVKGRAVGNLYHTNFRTAGFR